VKYAVLTNNPSSVENQLNSFTSSGKPITTFKSLPSEAFENPDAPATIDASQSNASSSGFFSFHFIFFFHFISFHFFSFFVFSFFLIQLKKNHLKSKLKLKLKKGNTNVGAIVGGVIGGLVLLAIIVVIGVVVYKKKKSEMYENSTPSTKNSKNNLINME